MESPPNNAARLALPLPADVRAVQDLARGEPLRAFHGSPVVQRFYLDRVHAHAAADEFIRHVYYSLYTDRNGERALRGCGVGCTIHSADHIRYSWELGIPVELAHLEDALFESMWLGEAIKWPVRFLEAIPLGADLSRVGAAFALWLLTDPVHGVQAPAAQPLEIPFQPWRTFDQTIANLRAFVDGAEPHTITRPKGWPESPSFGYIIDGPRDSLAFAFRESPHFGYAESARDFAGAAAEHLLTLLAAAPVPVPV